MRWTAGLVAMMACIGGSEPAETDGDPTGLPTADTGTAPPPETTLLVLDSSDSMQRSAVSLALGLDAVVAALPTDGPLAVTTVDVEATAGALVGPPSRDPEVLAAQILCSATCFRSDLVLPSDPAHTCGDPLGSEVTSEWLDCACGVNAWQDQCGAAVEEGLEAVWLATCRADAAAPATCFDQGLMTPADAGTSGLEGPLHVVVLSDEGDGSRRLAQEPDATLYVDLLSTSSIEVTVSVVVPGLTKGAVTCPGVATDWGTQRYHDAATATGGAIVDVYDASCAPADAAAAVVSALDAR